MMVYYKATLNIDKGRKVTTPLSMSAEPKVRKGGCIRRSV
jgi:hypothetical protein